MIIITEENIIMMKEYVLPLDQRAEIRPGCITWRIMDAEGRIGQMTIWPDTDRGAISWGGNSAWGDWDWNERVLILDEDAQDGRRIIVYEDGSEKLVNQPWW